MSMRAVRNLWAIVVGAVTVAVIVALWMGTVPAASASEGCSNEARRVEQASTFLPNCRAYELVTPSSTAPSPEHLKYFEGEPDAGSFVTLPEGPEETSHGFRLTPTMTTTAAASDGDAFLFSSLEQPGPSLALCGCMSRRTPTGWVGEDPLPTISSVTIFCLGSAAISGWSEDLEKTVMVVGGEGERCGHAEPPLVPGEPGELESNQHNLFLRDNAGNYQLLDRAPPGVVPQNRLAAISADGSHVVFESNAMLTEDTPNGGVTNLYVWDSTQPSSLHLLTVLPNGSAVHGPGEGGAYLAGAMNQYLGGHTSLEIEEEAEINPSALATLDESAEVNHAISLNGERVLFYAGGRTIEGKSQSYYSGGGLYLREHPTTEQSKGDECTEAEQMAEPGKACTIQVDIDQGGSGKSGRGQFQWASAETTKIFFTDEERLTPDSTARSGEPDLYEYDLEKPIGQRLTDITANSSEPANVRGVSGTSEDGSYVYFVARGDLTGSQQNSHSSTALAPANGTGTLKVGSTEVTGLSTASGVFHAGMAISGAGVPERDFITAVGNGTLTIFRAAEASGSRSLSAEARNLYLRHAGATIFIAALQP